MRFCAVGVLLWRVTSHIQQVIYCHVCICQCTVMFVCISLNCSDWCSEGLMYSMVNEGRWHMADGSEEHAAGILLAEKKLLCACGMRVV